EGDCPAELAPRLLQTAKQVRADADIACVLARRMIENWFVATAASLAGVAGLPTPLQAPDRPEECHGAGWLNQQIRSRNPARKYAKTTDARTFVAAMDLRQCRQHAPSFDKLCRELARRLPSGAGPEPQQGKSLPPDEPSSS